MRWEDLTSGDFAKAVETSKRTCVLPFGSIEKHGGQLPLGTDMFCARYITEEAAKIEPVVIFPFYPFGQMSGGMNVPGAIAVNQQVMITMLHEIFREISRNGFKKIIIYSTHGGNSYLLPSVVFDGLFERTDYVPYYLFQPDLSREAADKVKELLNGGNFDGHAGSIETSQIMAILPELVKMEQCEPEGIPNYDRLSHLKGLGAHIVTPVDWHADHPTHQSGDPQYSKPEIGAVIFKSMINDTAKIFKAIKDDEVVAGLVNEYFETSWKI